MVTQSRTVEAFEEGPFLEQQPALFPLRKLLAARAEPAQSHHRRCDACPTRGRIEMGIRVLLQLLMRRIVRVPVY